jgi:hypothetical protein
MSKTVQTDKSPGKEGKLKTKSEVNLDLARRIRAAGVPIHIAEDDEKTGCMPSDGLIVRQQGAVADSTAFEFEAGTGFIINLAITVSVPSMAISYFGLDLPWEKINFRWLPDPLESGDDSMLYKFAGKDSLAFERSEVMNHYADVRQMLQHGRSIAGLLLGLSMEPIPDEFRTGTLVPATVVIGDQFSREFRSEVSLFINKREKHVRRAGSEIRRRGGLFEKRDRITSPAN